jgi:putative MATE family efflux protein
LSNCVLEKQKRDKSSEIIISGKISSAVWYLAWPTIINTLFQTAYGIINRAFLGGLKSSAEAQAAIGVGSMAPMIAFTAVFGVSAGVSALVARFIGAEENDDAIEATRQSLILAFIGGILSTIVLLFVAAPFVRILGAKEHVIPLAAGYTMMLGVFSIPFCIMVIGTSVLRATGNVRAPVCIGITVLCLNIIFDYLLIFGVGPFPMLGVRGAALATGISYVVGMLMIIWFLRKSILRTALSHFRPHISWFARVLNVGWPASLQHLLYASGFSVYLFIIGALPNPTAIQAALTVAIGIESLSFMPGVAYNIAATPLVGQNLGAGNIKRAERCSWTASGHAVFIMSIVAIIFLIIPEPLAHIFTKDPAVVKLIVLYLRINALCQPFLAVGMVLAGALQGAGDTRMPTFIEFVAQYVTRLPLAWLLAVILHYDAAGAWIAMSVSNVFYGFLMMVWFRKGNWKTLQI